MCHLHEPADTWAGTVNRRRRLRSAFFSSGRRLTHRGRRGLLPDGCGHPRAPDPRFCGEEISSAIQQRLAAQTASDVAGFADRGPGCLVIGQVAEVFGVVERAVGQVAAVERWCRPATTARRRPGRRRTGIGTGRRAGGRPSRIRHTVGTGSITTTTARPRTGRRLLIWRVSGHVMCEQASRRGPAGRWRAALPRARRPLPCSCCCR